MHAPPQHQPPPLPPRRAYTVVRGAKVAFPQRRTLHFPYRGEGTCHLTPVSICPFVHLSPDNSDQTSAGRTCSQGRRWWPWPSHPGTVHHLLVHQPSTIWFLWNTKHFPKILILCSASSSPQALPSGGAGGRPHRPPPLPLPQPQHRRLAPSPPTPPPPWWCTTTTVGLQLLHPVIS